MASSGIITFMIILCLIFMALVVFAKPLKYLLRFIIRLTCGVLGSLLFNFILSPFGIAIGINYLNAFIVGLLGIPGFVSLYILSFLM